MKIDSEGSPPLAEQRCSSAHCSVFVNADSESKYPKTFSFLDRSKLKYLLVSLLSVVYVVTMTSSCVALGISKPNAYLIAILTAWTINYFTSKRLVFANRRESTLRMLVGYAVVVIGMRIVEYISFCIAVQRIAFVPYQAIIIVIQAITFLLKYYLLRYVLT